MADIHRFPKSTPIVEYKNRRSKLPGPKQPDYEGERSLKKKKNYHEDRTKGEPAQEVGIDTSDPWVRVLIALGKRAQRTDTGFILDGRPAGYYDCIIAANRVFKSLEMPQIDGNKAWIVYD